VWAAIDSGTAASSGANAGVVVGEQAVAVIDTFASIDAAKQLHADIRKLTKLPIKFVINTHYHLDHVAGNGVFAADGAVLLAHRNVRDWIHAETLRLVTEGMAAEQKTITREQREFIEALVAPTAVYDGSMDLYLGSRRLQVRSFPGHTGGDSVVFVPDVSVAFTGDLFWHNNIPNAIDASMTPWIDTLNRFADSYAQYKFVAGHGDVGTVTDVIAFRDYLATLRTSVTDAQADGKSGETVADTVLPMLATRYGQWNYFKENAHDNIMQTDAELRGEKRIPQP
jgi:glyoxylase-like metal-dependent hydrolase (beta-lactamase superfamily II)